jgi:hypothetical protein
MELNAKRSLRVRFDLGLALKSKRATLMSLQVK